MTTMGESCRWQLRINCGWVRSCAPVSIHTCASRKPYLGMTRYGHMVRKRPYSRVSDSCCLLSGRGSRGERGLRPKISPAPTAGSSTAQVPDARETVEHRSPAVGMAVSVYPSLLDAIIIVQPETVLRWHRRGFRAYWRWKSRHVGGRPRMIQMRALIRRISCENPLWGAPRIHGELLMLGIEVAESAVGRYMVRRRRPPSQVGRLSCVIMLPASLRWICSWCAPSRQAALWLGEPASRPQTASFISVTSNPTAEWLAGQVTDAFPWDEAPVT